MAELMIARAINLGLNAATGGFTRLRVPLPRQEVAVVVGIDFLMDDIAIIGPVIGITHDNQPTDPTGIEQLFEDPLIWAIHPSYSTHPRWTPPAEFLIGGDQSLIGFNGSGNVIVFGARLLYTRRKVDIITWSDIKDRTVKNE